MHTGMQKAMVNTDGTTVPPTTVCLLEERRKVKAFGRK